MCNRIAAAFVFALTLLVACGPTPPSPLSSPTSSSTDGGSGSGTSTTTGGNDNGGTTSTSGSGTTTGSTSPNPGNPNSENPNNGAGNGNNPNTQNPNSGDPNSGDPNSGNPNSGNPNTQNPLPPEVAAFFAPSSSNPNVLYVVITSDGSFCTRLTANAVQKSSVETQLQIADPNGAGTYAIPTQAQLDNLDLNATCEGTQQAAQTGSVTLSAVSSALVSGSYQFVNGNTSGSGNFTATACRSLADGMPSGSATSSLSCQ